MRRWGVWGARGGMVLVSRECVVVLVLVSLYWCRLMEIVD